MDLAPPLTRLIDALKTLPSIGQKSAQRIAFHLLRASSEQTSELAAALLAIKDQLKFCTVCNNITDCERCHFCSSEERNGALLCVVEEPHNVLVIERTRQFHGRYHVLLGSIAPLRGIGPEQLRIPSLLERLGVQDASGEPVVREVILATDPDAEGEATALYLARLLKPLGVHVSRIGMGIPVGSEIEYADEVTMAKALEGRREW